MLVALRMHRLTRLHSVRIQGGEGALHSPGLAAEVAGQEAVPDIGHLSQQLRIGFFPQHELPLDWSHMLDMTLFCPLPAIDFKI